MKVVKFENLAEMECRAVSLLEEHFSMRCGTPHAVMLTGGQTPMGIYRRLEQRPPRVDDSLRLMITDERHVLLESPESNYGRMRAMVDGLGLGEARVMRVHTEFPLDAAADGYHDELAAFLRSGGLITLGLAGLGADGHIASLFDIRDLERGHGRFAIPVPRESGPDRVSVTQDLLARVEQLVFLVAGPEKSAVVETLIHEPKKLVAGQAVEYVHRVELWRS
jgi:6-phosphogluconolactonase